MVKTPDIIKEASKNLRKNMTPSEEILWNSIRSEKLGIKFLRQKPIYVYTEVSGLDRFIIPDFISLSEKIIIEIDGGIHDELEVYNLDRHKEELVKILGYQVIRFTNDEINNTLDDVIKKLTGFIKK